MALIAACLWLIAANVAALLPSQDNHWRRAYGLIALALPLVLWLWTTQSPLWALLFVAMAASMLRWPLRYAWRWMCRRAGRKS